MASADMTARMRSLSEFPADRRAAVTGLFCDIDDTLTSGGRLTASAYAALERLHRAGLTVVPITGRPAGWCDLIARFWPVSAVVGENGAFYFAFDRRKKRMTRRYQQSEAQRAEGRRKLEDLKDRVLSAFPGTAVASDQHYREADLAIDYCEDVAPLGRDQAERIAEMMRQAGATAKVSSIHVNCWFGSYDKLTMARLLMSEVFAVDLDRQEQDFVFIGDSPNDEPMFAHFTNSVAVANIADFEGQLEHLPSYVTEAREGAGFAELAESLLTTRTTVDAA